MYWNSHIQSGSRRMLNHWQSGGDDGKGRYIIDPNYNYPLPKGPILISGNSADSPLDGVPAATGSTEYYNNIDPRLMVVNGAYFLDNIKNYNRRVEQYIMPNIFVMPPELKYPIEIDKIDDHSWANVTNAVEPYILRPLKGGDISWMFPTMAEVGPEGRSSSPSIEMCYRDDPDKIYRTIYRDEGKRIEWHEQYRKVADPKYPGTASITTAPKKQEGYCRLYVSITFVVRLFDRVDVKQFGGRIKTIRGWYYVKTSESSIVSVYSKSMDGKIYSYYDNQSRGDVPWKYGGKMSVVTNFLTDV